MCVPTPQAYLRGFFCFQVQKHHYVAFVYNRGRQEWVLLDDDQAVPVRNRGFDGEKGEGRGIYWCSCVPPLSADDAWTLTI